MLWNKIKSVATESQIIENFYQKVQEVAKDQNTMLQKAMVNWVTA